MKRKGFSILELLLVLFIFSLSMALAAPSLSKFYKTAQLKTTTQRISAILRHSRSEAIHRGEIYQVLFDSYLKEVKIRSLRLSEAETEERKDQKRSIQTFSVPKWMDFREIKIPPSLYPSDHPAIEFYPNGRSNGGSFTLEGGNHQGYLIQVHFLTGMVTIRKV